MRSNVSANMLWVITQTQVKSLRVNALLERYLREGERAEQVSQAYQMLASRFSLLMAGPQLRYLEGLDSGPALIANIQLVRDTADTVTLTSPDVDPSAERLLDALGSL